MPIAPVKDYEAWKNSVMSNGQLFIQGEQASIQYGDLNVELIFDDVEQTVYLGQSAFGDESEYRQL